MFIVVYKLILYGMVVNFCGDQNFVDFVRFLIMIIYEVLYA